MPHQYKRKYENYGKTPAHIMKDAAMAVMEGDSERQTAKRLGIARGTLKRYIKKIRKDGLEKARLTPNYFHSKVFTDNHEKDLAQYLEVASRMHHGLTTHATRQLAYQFATRNNIAAPSSWDLKQEAGLYILSSEKHSHIVAFVLWQYYLSNIITIELCPRHN